MIYWFKFRLSVSELELVILLDIPICTLIVLTIRLKLFGLEWISDANNFNLNSIPIEEIAFSCSRLVR